MKHLYTTLFLLACMALNAQQPTHTVFLIGDAGKSATPGPSLQLLDEQLKETPNGSVIFLGDNIYPSGLHLSKDDTTESERNLLCQLKIVKDYKGNVVFVPGNHDWNEGKAGGLATVKTEQEYIGTFRMRSVVKPDDLLQPILSSPRAGQPGPESFLLAPGIRMIALDTQWFLHFYKKDNVAGKDRKQTAEAFYHNLDSLLNYCQTNNEKALLVYHHPLFTNGGHGARKQPLRFLINYTPFQLLGLIGGNRWLVQDIPQPRFKKMRNRLLEIMAKYPGIINASGHEHYLQHYIYGDDSFIVSGSGSKLSHKKVDIYKECFFEDQQPGFAKLMFYADGSAKVEYWGAKDRKVLITIDLAVRPLK